VLPPTLRLIDLRLSTPLFRVGGRTAIKWYMTDAAAVTVKLEQISRKGKHLLRGSAQNALRRWIPHRDAAITVVADDRVIG